MSLKMKIFQNSSWNLAGYFYLLVAALVALPLTIRGLGADNYARYLVVIAFSTVLTSFDLGIPASLVRSLASASSSIQDKVVAIRTSLFITLLMGLLVTTIAYFGTILGNNTVIFGLNPGDMRGIASAVATYTFVNFLISVISAIPQGKGDFMVYSVRAFVVGTGNTFIAASVALATGSLSQVLWAQVHSATFALFLLVIYTAAVHGFRPLFPTYNKESARSLFHFGIPSFIGNLAPQLQANIAKVLTSANLSVTSLNSLGISQSLTFKGSGIFGQITNALFPTATVLATKGEMKKLRQLTFRLTLLLFVMSVSAALAFYFYGKFLLNWWLADSVLAASIFPVLLIYLIFVIILSLTPIPAIVLSALGKPGVVSFYSWVEVLTEIAILYFLVPSYGVIGVPIAAIVAQLLITPFFLWRVNKALKS